METYKASSLTFWRDHLRRNHPDKVAALRARMDEETRRVYDSCLALSWVDVNAAGRIMTAVAETLHPGDQQGLFKLGRQQAHENLTGMYSVLLRMATVPFAIKQTAVMWSTYHRRGTATSQREGEANIVTLVVAGYPEFPPNLRRNMSGFVHGVLELVRVKEPRVIERFENPASWKWELRWS